MTGGGEAAAFRAEVDAYNDGGPEPDWKRWCFALLGQIREAPHAGEASAAPACPECSARARRHAVWAGGLPGGGDWWRCAHCGSKWATPPAGGETA